MANRKDQLLRAAWTADKVELPSHALRWLRAETGLTPVATPTRPLTAPPSELPDKAREVLSEIAGAENVLTDEAGRLGRTGGLSYLDLLAHKGIGEVPVPDAVVLPADPEQVTAVLKACAELNISVVPFGGGTSVVGGVTATRGSVVLDLARLDRLVSVDQVSRLAVFQAGVRAPDAEKALAPYGLTLGHVPQSFERATIGGFAATRSAGQASSGYGRFEDMVEGVRIATPRGDWELGVAPASAAGPDLKQLVVGSEGAFGVITEVTVRVRPLPQARRYEGFILDGWEKGAEAVRTLAQARVLADVTRLSDVDETDVSFALTGGLKAQALKAYLKARGIAQPCMLILGWEAEDERELALRRATTLMRLRGAIRLGRMLGEAWRHGRFNGPRQRDALMSVGVCVETLETATHWSNLSELHTKVREALRNSLSSSLGKPIVMCHISHAYETGASLYFTVLVPRAQQDPAEQWRRAKAAACEAIVGIGTISHHHAVGIDHAPYLPAEIGDLGVEVLAAVKNTLDPAGILNPGKLIP